MVRANMLMSVWHLAVVGIIAVVSVYLYNDYIAGKKIAGMTMGRA